MADGRSPIRGRGEPGRREFGRDGISGLVNADRAVRAREVSRPGEQDRLQAELVLDSLLRRVSGRRR